MILEKIKDFEWYNEPQNVSFSDRGLKIETLPDTDFWQSADYNFFKDNGHFFYQKKSGDFVLTAKWFFPKTKDSAQCGIMVRCDAQNWIKTGLLSPSEYHSQLGVVVSSQGTSDWSNVDIPETATEVSFKIKRRGNDFVVWYALDDKTFRQARMTHLSKITPQMLIGAYTCSPKGESFECILEDIDIKD